jgi:hypothetical protein
MAWRNLSFQETQTHDISGNLVNLLTIHTNGVQKPRDPLAKGLDQSGLSNSSHNLESRLEKLMQTPKCLSGEQPLGIAKKEIRRCKIRRIGGCGALFGESYSKNVTATVAMWSFPCRYRQLILFRVQSRARGARPRLFQDSKHGVRGAKLLPLWKQIDGMES